MTPERWRQITELFHAAREQDPMRREAFLAGACREDATLRREVEAMLTGHDHGGPLDEASLFTSVFRLEPGFALGPYRIERLIGAGGMGEVYRARDTTLGRDVAVKILPRGFTSDHERLARFEREARVLAALNHPHIATIYGLEEADGVRGLVLELVEGQTVAERLHAGPLTVSESLTIARQIADALEAAHEKGIVHRDLKPANIKITPEGVVKVLDFGLATAGAGLGPDRSKSPTLTVGRTGPGFILGTVAYMSPEQARGRVVDKRADIWAFGCVMYEMLAGRGAFPGETMSDTIVAILQHEPQWSALPAQVPDAIQRLLKRCLKKDPADRLHDVADARIEIVETQSAPPSDRHLAAPLERRERVLWMAFALMALATTVAVWLLAGHWNRVTTSTGLVELGVRFPETVPPAYGVAVSPDGRRVAVGTAGARFQIWLYSLDSTEPRPLPGTEGGMLPFWSHDGSSIGFFTADGKQLKRIDPAGGPAVLICEVTAGTWLSQAGTWSADGVIVFASASELFRVSASGGTPVPIVVSDQAGEPSRRSMPQFLPDNRHFIYHAIGPHGGSVHAASLDSGQTKRLLDSDFAAAYAAPNYLLFVRGTALMAQALNPKTLDLDGQAVLIAPNVAPGFLNGLALFSASNTGVLAFVKTRAGTAGQLTWVDRAGKPLGLIPQPPGEEYLNPAISPNGELVAVNRMDPQTGNWDIWIVDITRGVSTRFTSEPARDSDPVWSPDGREIVFASDRGGEFGLYRKAVGGSESEELLARIEGHVGAVVPTDWSRDGKFVLFSQFDPAPWSLWALPLVGNRKPIRVLQNEFRHYGGRLSPDNDWVAYQSYETGSFEVYVQRFLAPGERKQVSRGAGSHPRWTAGGRELVYDSFGRGLESVDLNFSGSGFRASVPKTLGAPPILGLIDARSAYDVTRDGQRFLLRQPTGPPGSAMTVMLNWTERLKK
jgi:serine/threonine protein kinase/Tol biopolymer transport system component